MKIQHLGDIIKDCPKHSTIGIVTDGPMKGEKIRIGENKKGRLMTPEERRELKCTCDLDNTTLTVI